VRCLVDCHMSYDTFIHLNAIRYVAINKTSHRRTLRHETQTHVTLTHVCDVCERTHRHLTQTHETRCLQVQHDSRACPMSITHISHTHTVRRRVLVVAIRAGGIAGRVFAGS